MASEPNGNGNGSVPNKVLGWALAAIAGGAAVVGPLYVGLASEKQHLVEVLTLRDRIHEAKQDALRAQIAGQDTVLQREMRLLNDALRVKVEESAAEILRLRDERAATAGGK